MTQNLQSGFDQESESEMELALFLEHVSSLKERGIERICARLEREVTSQDHDRRLHCAEVLLSPVGNCIPPGVRDHALHELLFSSAFCSDIILTKVLLDAGLNVNAYDIRSNFTTLALASVAEDQEYIKYLLERGADPLLLLNGADSVLETYVHSAKPETLRILLDHCPNICERLIAQPNLFDACIQVGRPENISVLLDKFQEQGIEVTMNPELLLAIALEEDASNFRRLMDLGLTFNVFDDIVIKAFFHAIKSGNKEVVEIFLENGMLPSSDYKGNQPIHYAIKFERLDILKMLFRFGVNINGYNAEQEHPLILAANTGNLELFSFLMEMEPRLDALNLDELIEAMNLKMKVYHPEIVKMRDALIHPEIFQKGIDESYQWNLEMLIDGKSDEECINLIKELLQAEYVQSTLIERIIDTRKLNINQMMDKNGTFLHFSAEHNLPYAIEVLVKLGADIDARNDCFGRTPLMTAICAKNREASLSLINNAADCEMADELEFTPVMEAVHAFGDDDSVVIALLRAGAHDHDLIFVSDN